jgi:hypothetical protein
MVNNPIDVGYRNALLWIIYRVETPALQKRLLECVRIVDYEATNSQRYIDALKEIEAFGNKHLL